MLYCIQIQKYYKIKFNIKYQIIYYSHNNVFYIGVKIWYQNNTKRQKKVFRCIICNKIAVISGCPSYIYLRELFFHVLFSFNFQLS